MLTKQQLQSNAQKFIPSITMKQAKVKYNNSKAWGNFVEACRSNFIRSLKHEEQNGICPVCYNAIDLTIECKNNPKCSSVLHHISYTHQCFINDYILRCSLGDDDCHRVFLREKICHDYALFPDNNYRHPCDECIKNFVLVHADCHSKIHVEQVKKLQKDKKLGYNPFYDILEKDL